MFENYKDSLFNDEIIIKSQQRFRIDHHRVYSEEVNKIVLSSNDHKKYKHLIRLQRILTVCEKEILVGKKKY